MVIVGIDLSLNSTGVCILKDNTLETSRIKPEGKTRRKRLNSIYEQLTMLWQEVGTDIDLIVLEEPLVTKYINIVTKILAVHGVFAASLGALDMSTPILTVHPTTLKKFVTGNGKATKDDIKAVIEDITSFYMYHDESDATALAIIGKVIDVNKLQNDENRLSELTKNTILQVFYP